ncbi:MAG: S8 family serine peptidase [Betaproteobacteria bacterium]|nr:S8 family serine peptidase [Betaproteobacteria bacterium]
MSLPSAPRAAPTLPPPAMFAPAPITSVTPPPALIRPVEPSNLPTSVAPTPEPPGVATHPHASAPPKNASKNPAVTVEPGQVVLFFATDAEAERALAALPPGSARVVDRARLATLGGQVVTLKSASHADAARLQEQLRLRLPDTPSDFHSRYTAFGATRLYHAAQMRLPPQDPVANIRIGMVDTAVSDLPAFKGAKLFRRRFLAPDERDASAGHGTATAALLVAESMPNGFSGVARGATLLAANVFHQVDDAAVTNTASLARALDWLAEENTRVINLSLGGSGDRIMAEIVRRLLDRGIVLVAAGGNGGPEGTPVFPAAYPGVIAVAAVDASGQAYANGTRGAYLAIAAPGVDLWVPDSEVGRYVTGTSHAAALVAGVAARLIAQHRELTASQVREHLCRSALDLGPPGTDSVFGCGLLQWPASSPIMVESRR